MYTYIINIFITLWKISIKLFFFFFTHNILWEIFQYKVLWTFTHNRDEIVQVHRKTNEIAQKEQRFHLVFCAKSIICYSCLVVAISFLLYICIHYLAKHYVYVYIIERDKLAICRSIRWRVLYTFIKLL